jgi:hypothetical protein
MHKAIHIAKSLKIQQHKPKLVNKYVFTNATEKESTGIQHCIRAIAGEVVIRRSVHLINFCGGGQVIALKSATSHTRKPLGTI